MKYKLWIKAAALLTVLCMLSATLLACGKVRPIKGTDEELAPVGTVAGHEVLYEELRYLTLIPRVLQRGRLTGCQNGTAVGTNHITGITRRGTGFLDKIF